MNAPSVARMATDRLTAEVAAWGSRRVETGGFLLADATRPNVTANVVALAGSTGIVRRRQLFAVSGSAIEQLFEWASDSELRICAQFHSHAREAFLSRTDIEHGFAVEGFITTVVPHFTAPSPRPEQWGWWQRHSGTWQPLPAPVLRAGRARVVHFDERGIRAA